jgi:hypothetical protein
MGIGKTMSWESFFDVCVGFDTLVRPITKLLVMSHCLLHAIEQKNVPPRCSERSSVISACCSTWAAQNAADLRLLATLNHLDNAGAFYSMNGVNHASFCPS